MTETTALGLKAKYKYRPPIVVTWAVWRALFLREAMSRLMVSRSAPFWLLVEPVFHTSYMLFILTVVRARVVSGMDTIAWLLAGILPFFIFRRVAMQASKAIGSNTPLFNYRQVKPIDTILVRSFLEVFIMIIVSAIMFGGAHLFGFDVAPADPMGVFIAVFGLAMLSLGWALVTSVARELILEAGDVLDMFQAPLYLLSGSIFPLAHLPYQFRSWLMLNPIAHSLEGVRQSFSPYYHGVPETSMVYLYVWALTFLFFGFALHRHFAAKLASK